MDRRERIYRSYRGLTRKMNGPTPPPKNLPLPRLSTHLQDRHSHHLSIDREPRSTDDRLLHGHRTSFQQISDTNPPYTAPPNSTTFNTEQPRATDISNSQAPPVRVDLESAQPTVESQPLVMKILRQLTAKPTLTRTWEKSSHLESLRSAPPDYRMQEMNGMSPYVLSDHSLKTDVGLICSP